MQAIDANARPVRANITPEGWDTLDDAVGDIYQVRTTANTLVNVWRAREGTTLNHRYWCHGHSTLSFYLHGYSIFSHIDMAAVLQDEWFHVPKKPLAGDIVIWRDSDGRIMHSARIESAVHSKGSSTVKILSTKNGSFGVTVGQSVDAVTRAYSQDKLQWRVPSGSCCFGKVDKFEKQYYRRSDRTIDVNYRFEARGAAEMYDRKKRGVVSV